MWIWGYVAHCYMEKKDKFYTSGLVIMLSKNSSSFQHHYILLKKNTAQLQVLNIKSCFNFMKFLFEIFAKAA